MCEVIFKHIDCDTSISHSSHVDCGHVTYFNVGQDPALPPHRYLDYVSVNGKIILKDTCTLTGDYTIYHEVPTDPTIVVAQFILDPTSRIENDCITLIIFFS